MRFRKKPVEIQAWRVDELNHWAALDFWKLPEPVIDAYDRGGVVFGALKDGIGPERGIYVPTLEGSMFAASDDWIIQGVKGELYPCKPDIFEATYEAVAQTMEEWSDPFVYVEMKGSRRV